MSFHTACANPPRQTVLRVCPVHNVIVFGIPIRICAIVIFLCMKCCCVILIHPETGATQQSESEYSPVSATVDPVIWSCYPGIGNSDCCSNCIRLKSNHIALEIVEAATTRQIGRSPMIVEIIVIPGAGGNVKSYPGISRNAGASSQFET